MGVRAAVYSHNGTKKSAWDVVAGLGVIEWARNIELR